MPYTINGIGTWYYGRTRVHTLRDTCEFCNAFGDMSSYDTTHYFVFLFVPLIPIGKYRILKDCPHYRKHRVMPLKKWEKAKQDSIAEVYAKLRQKLDDPEAVKHAIGVAVGYQDEGLLLRVAEHLAGPMSGDADVQRALGAAFAYFAKSTEAERAYRAALQLKEDPETRHYLSVEILKQGRPDEAEAILRPILDQRNPEHIGLLMLLVEGYQAQANYPRALELLDACEQLNPALQSDKSWVKFRKSVQKHAQSGRPAPSTTLAQSKTAGYREGGGGSRIARWIGPAVAYLGGCST